MMALSWMLLSRDSVTTLLKTCQTYNYIILNPIKLPPKHRYIFLMLAIYGMCFHKCPQFQLTKMPAILISEVKLLSSRPTNVSMHVVQPRQRLGRWGSPLADYLFVNCQSPTMVKASLITITGFH